MSTSHLVKSDKIRIKNLMHTKKDFIEAGVVVAIAVIGMVMACVQHFHENGFFLGFIGFSISTIWIIIMIKDNLKERAVEQR